MPVTADQLKSWCKNVLAGDPQKPKPTLKQYLDAIPKLGSLADVPKGTSVLVRGDVDAKPGETIGKGDIRLRSMKETLQFGRERGWKQIIFGHIGREPEGSLDKVAKRIGEILGCEVTLVDNWMDDATGKINDDVAQKIADAPAGAVLVLQNTRKYKLETVLWKKKPDDVDKMDAEFTKLATLCNDFASKVAKVYVNEALSAGSMDTSSVVVPAAMDKVALGKYCESEFEGPMMECMAAKLVVFSGIKIDKLDDLEAMIERGNIKTVISAGSIAMALKKADVELKGGQFPLGASENPANAKLPFYIPPDRIEQAKRIISQGQAQGVEFHLPVDFMLEDGTIVDKLGPDDAQFDIGPATGELFERAIADFIKKSQPGADSNNVVAFHNGVFGKFEDKKFAEGTRRFVQQLAVLKDAGVKVYVGGGEGGKAVTQYLGDDKITHMFTAGGTVLNALGSEPVPYLVALKMAAQK